MDHERSCARQWSRRDGPPAGLGGRRRGRHTAAVAQRTGLRGRRRPFSIVYEDDALIVVDKRAGLVVHPGSGNWSGTLLNGLLHHDPALAGVPRAGIVHRLDKDTSGLMVVAKTLEAQTDLVRQLQARTVSRRYVALVHGEAAKSGRIALSIGRDPRDRLRMAAFKTDDASPHVKAAVTKFRTLAISSGISFVLCTLETGRTHQIRVHLRAIGHPLMGDPVYGGPRRSPAFARQALHAWRLGLVHPTSREDRHWTAALPSDLDELARSSGFDPDALLAGAADDER